MLWLFGETMSKMEKIDACLAYLGEDIARATHTVVYEEPREGLIALHGVVFEMFNVIAVLRNEIAALHGEPRTSDDPGVNGPT
jgi:hypothetical protein